MRPGALTAVHRDSPPAPATRRLRDDAPRRPATLRIAMVSCSQLAVDPRLRARCAALLERGHQLDLVSVAGPGSEPIGNEALRQFDIRVRHARRGLARTAGEHLSFVVQAFTIITREHIPVAVRRRVRLQHAELQRLHRHRTLVQQRATLVLDVHDPVLELLESIAGRPVPPAVRRVAEWEERVSIRFVDTVMTVNEPMRELLEGRTRMKRDAVIVMNLPDRELFRPRTGARTHGDPPVVYSGVLTSRHGVDLVVRAVAPPGARASTNPVADRGRRPRSRSAPRARARVRDLDRTEFVGAVPLRRVPELVRDASVAVSSHRSDVFGELVFSTKAAEYVAIGIPTVCASTTTMHDYFTDDELCFFDAGDPDDLAEHSARSSTTATMPLA